MTRSVWTTLWSALVIAGILGSDARAEDASQQSTPKTVEPIPAFRAPPLRLLYRNATSLRLNAIGLVNESRFLFRERLYESASVAFADNFAGVGPVVTASPAFLKVGALAELQPASFVQLWALYEVATYFGTFNQMQSFEGAGADYRDATLKALNDLPTDNPLRPYKTSGTQLTLGGLLQGKVGPVALRTQAKMVRPDVALRRGDRVFYDQTPDTLVANQAWYVTNDLDLLFQTSFGLTAGVRYAMTHAFFGKYDRLPGETRSSVDPTAHRVGPLVAYTFAKEDGSKFSAPTAFLLVNWHLVHRYRAGLDSSKAIPMIATGFAFSGDLL